MQSWLLTETFCQPGRSSLEAQLIFQIIHKDILTAIRAKPAHYTLSIHDIEFGGLFSYQGTVSITTKIDKNDGFSNLVLNAHQLKIHSAELKTGESTKAVKDISYDEKRQRVTLDFGEKIKYSGEAVLEVKFEGTINNVSRKLWGHRKLVADFPDHGWFLPLQVQAQGRGPCLSRKG